MRQGNSEEIGKIGEMRDGKREGDVAREDARTAVRCTVFAFSPPCTRSPGFEVGNERERS